MRKANSTTGAVYCPAALYDGCVTKVEGVSQGTSGTARRAEDIQRR